VRKNLLFCFVALAMAYGSRQISCKIKVICSDIEVRLQNKADSKAADNQQKSLLASPKVGE